MLHGVNSSLQPFIVSSVASLLVITTVSGVPKDQYHYCVLLFIYMEVADLTAVRKASVCMCIAYRPLRLCMTTVEQTFLNKQKMILSVPHYCPIQ